MRRSTLTLVMTTLACSPHAPPPSPEVVVADPAAEGPPEPAAPREPLPPKLEPREPLPPKSPPASTTWTTLTVAPGCELQIADTPADLGPPLVWTPCKGGPEGCLEAPTQTAEALAPDVDVVGLSRGGQVTIAALRSLQGPRSRYVLAPRDGLPFFAVEGPRDVQCSLGQVGLSDDGAVIEVVFDNAGGYASRAYLRGPLAEDAAWREVAAVLPRKQFRGFIGESALSVGGRVVVEQNGGRCAGTTRRPSDGRRCRARARAGSAAPAGTATRWCSRWRGSPSGRWRRGSASGRTRCAAGRSQARAR
ncbi:hypothetical protein [Nannocystis pusilla]|uniref:hypothetical protein n=1 Tax=Nannocystis pusilla TaxID=889268 RepID=UPI003B76EBDB